ncbi:hypothetical protein AGMMS49944_00380 [Spirochaetia bacterium]|nr:hypothetical protein AGMMS49944_00380 [Spirochaetia bacterium]
MINKLAKELILTIEVLFPILHPVVLLLTGELMYVITTRRDEESDRMRDFMARFKKKEERDR